MRVHATLGNGFPEVIYQRSLAVEMSYAGLPFEREIDRTVFYRNEPVGARRVDFLVDNVVLVELKASHELTNLHHAQIINYLTAFQLEVGLLLNFGEKSLSYKRFVKSH
ncbi:GxxExxY protein [Hymenobacter sediminis]|uniref:GxxExxY protein n=1 Tax=Hymenobacter sediminis TaxID=2218621 RepID=UPI002936E80D|nr:GxxExxY protein [Hymenobacter sediminis]